MKDWKRCFWKRINIVTATGLILALCFTGCTTKESNKPESNEEETQYEQNFEVDEDNPTGEYGIENSIDLDE